MSDPSAAWIDSHCHLQERYRESRGTLEDVVAESVAAGVGGLVCIGTDARTSREALAVVGELRSLPGCDGESFGAWATLGLHPHDASSGTEELEAVLGDASAQTPELVVAVGECGLDYHYDHSPRAVQREVFAAQVAMAAERDLALVVHTREAWDDTFDILHGPFLPERVVFHCFTGGVTEARRCLDLGAFLSFSGIVTFNNATEVRDALRMCPSDRLLVETDAPFLSPVPNRGQKNRPAWVALVGEAAAALRSTSPSQLASSTAAATRAAFQLG